MRINYETDLGAIADDNSLNVQLRNGHLLNITISNSSTFPPGSTLYIPPKVFNLMGGIISKGLHNVTIELAGTLKFSFDVGLWPRNNSTGKVLDSLDFRNVSDFKITNGASSTSTPNIPISHKNLGIIDGQGGSWWDIPWSDKFGYLKNKNDRPRLLNIEGGLRMVIEVSERSERALMKTRLLAMNPSKLLQTGRAQPPLLSILYYTILYYTILYYTILYYTILYYTILYYTILTHSFLLARSPPP